MTPTLILTATSGNVTVVSKYYGEVDSVRAKAEVTHRAEQLNLSRVERIRREREDFSD